MFMVVMKRDTEGGGHWRFWPSNWRRGFCRVNSDSNHDFPCRIAAYFLAFSSNISNLNNHSHHLEIWTRLIRILLCWADCSQTLIDMPRWPMFTVDNKLVLIEAILSPAPDPIVASRCETCSKYNLRLLSPPPRPRAFFNLTFVSDFIFYAVRLRDISMISVGDNVHDEETVSNSKNYII